MPYRNNYEIIDEILKYCNGNSRVMSHIMGVMHLSYTQWNKIYKPVLLANDLLVERPTGYQTTQRGISFIHQFAAIQSLLSKQ